MSADRGAGDGTTDQGDHDVTEPDRAQGFATRAIHAGQAPDPSTGAVTPPIHQTSTFVQDAVGSMRAGYEYALELGAHGGACASGLAAEDALLRALLRPGDRVVLGNDVYGGTHRLLDRLLRPWGVLLDTVEMTDPAAVAAALAAGDTRVLWVETPSNPLMKITDIAALAHAGHDAGARVVVDNTFASPALQQPLTLGADVVVHSATKYLGGHSDVLGGVVVTNDDELAASVRFLQFAAGAVLAPMEAWLTTRGIKTLDVRMQRHSANAAAIAAQLVAHPAIATVHYPGLASHPGHEIAARQMHAFGGMLSVAVAGGATAARRLAEGTRLFALAESLGGVESLVGYPSEMTHASVKGTALAVPEDVVRFSVGIEDVADLQADLEQALARL